MDLIVQAVLMLSCTQSNGQTMKKELTPEEKRVIVGKGTEAPFSGEYYRFKGKGTYCCKQCGAPLYRSSDKFDSGCGWPSFDDEIAGGRQAGSRCGRASDGDRLREMRRPSRPCFRGRGTHPEGYATLRQLGFVAVRAGRDRRSGTENRNCRFRRRLFLGRGAPDGQDARVLSIESGYTGGKTGHPTYREVCSHTTGHAEAVRIRFDPAVVSYETLARLFFEIHDPTQVDRQGPDVGDQYRSEIFYTTPEQKRTALELIGRLRAKGYDVVTKLSPATTFWKAEDYHQNYYDRKGASPYCHRYVKRF